jgi:hypothetical protein
VRQILKEWVAHYNEGRPHSSLGPGLPDSGYSLAKPSGHLVPIGQTVVAKSILNGLHYEYSLEKRAA